jgi:hypothetical protein
MIGSISFHFSSSSTTHRSQNAQGKISGFQVKQPFQRSENLDFVSLPAKDFQLRDGDLATVSGWGRLWVSSFLNVHSVICIPRAEK